MSEKQYRAAKYIRFSHADDKTRESDSVSNQRKILDSFIESQPDIEVVAEMVDDGVSGIIFDRPAFKEMMREIENGKIDCVIVKDLSRLGREYIETGRYLRQYFPALGVRFIALNDNIDTLKDSGDDLLVSVKSVINDSYCHDISVKTRSALNAKRAKGDYVGAFTTYGYKKAEGNRNQLVIDKSPAETVREIYRLKIEGVSALRIAEILNSRGVLSPMQYKKANGLPCAAGGHADKEDAKWSASTILRILHDVTYTGTLVQGRRGTLNYKIRDIIARPEAQWKRAENTHEAIIDKQDFELVQRIMRLDTRTAPRGGDKPDNDTVYPFSGILICDCCGARMTRKTVVSKGKSYIYYYCPAGKKRGCTGAAMIKENVLHECVLASIKAHVASIVSIEAILEGSDRQRALSALAGRLESQIAENERKIEEISGFKSGLYENMMQGLITAKEYRTYKDGYINDEKRLRDAIDALREEMDDILAGKSERLCWMDWFRRFDELSVLDRRMVVSLIQNIRVLSKTELQIMFAYQDEYEKAYALLQSREVA